MADNYDDYSKEELIKALRSRDRKPRFGLYWERDDIEHERAINDDFVALDLAKSLSCGNAPFQNLIIEGDNFDALRYLRMTYAGKVKCIYIDPPYNTGNKDFVYNDRFVDKDDVYKHSKWLEFMFRRLELARDLLTEDGVIFVSIDDNEQANLKLLMDEVFGNINFISTIAVINNFKGRSDGKYIATAHESLLIYKCKNFESYGVPIPEEYLGEYKLEDEHGKYRLQGLRKRGSGSKREDRPNMYYPVFYNQDTKTISTIRLLKNDIEIYPKLSDGSDGRWRWGKDTFEKYISEITVQLVKTRNEFDVFQKDYLNIGENEKRVKPKSFWMGSEFSSDAGTKTYKEIMQEQPFSYPKSIDLIKNCLLQATSKDDLILDFFAGSGTTAHAVLKLNAEDGGNRRFILVSNTEATETEPDKNLCRDVCAERVRRVMQGYSNQKGENVAGLGGNFAYLKTRRLTSETLLTEIEHPQIWTALQLIHGTALTAFNPDSTVQQLQTADKRVMYLSVLHLTEKEMTAVTDALKNQKLIVYSWQPALLIQHIEDDYLTIEAIPEFLTKRFSNLKT